MFHVFGISLFWSTFSRFRESLFALLDIMRVFSDHDSFILLVISANCPRELRWHHLEIDMLRRVWGISGKHWCRWEIITDLRQKIWGTPDIVCLLLTFRFPYIQTVVFPVSMSETSHYLALWLACGFISKYLRIWYKNWIYKISL